MTKGELRRLLAAGGAGAELLDSLDPDGPHGAVLIERLRFGPPETWAGWLKGYGRVAVKLFEPGTAMAADMDARAAFRHPLVARLLAWGEGWTVTAWAEGRTLDRPPVPASLMAQLAEAVAALHQAGLAHGDLKPANIVLTQNALALIDWGEDTCGTHGWRPDSCHTLAERDLFALDRLRG